LLLHLEASGDAFIFTLSSGLWTFQAQLQGSGSSSQNQFGTAVAISNLTAIAGSPGENNGAGVTYFFHGREVGCRFAV
jgi:hypothetical protein